MLEPEAEVVVRPFLGQDYDQLKTQALFSKQPFKDDKFPFVDFSKIKPLKNAKVEWLRPRAFLKSAPRFIVDGISPHDFSQGKIGNCWLIAALSALKSLPEHFAKMVVPARQSFADADAGIFHFRFWRAGEWHDVVVDDRLPVLTLASPKGSITKKPAFCHNRFVPEEMFGPLLEKAYAKFVGGYENLMGGTGESALVDMTGALFQKWSLSNSSTGGEAFQWLYAALNRAMLLNSAVIVPTLSVSPGATNLGLVKKHDYTVLGVYELLWSNKLGQLHKIRDVSLVEHEALASANLPFCSRDKSVVLVKLRNPWGSKKSGYTGPWNKDESGSDRSEWNIVSTPLKNDLLSPNNLPDGCFYMNLRDFFSAFHQVNFVHYDYNAVLTWPGPKKHDFPPPLSFASKWTEQSFLLSSARQQAPIALPNDHEEDVIVNLYHTISTTAPSSTAPAKPTALTATTQVADSVYITRGAKYSGSNIGGVSPSNMVALFALQKPTEEQLSAQEYFLPRLHFDKVELRLGDQFTVSLGNNASGTAKKNTSKKPATVESLVFVRVFSRSTENKGTPVNVQLELPPYSFFLPAGYDFKVSSKPSPFIDDRVIDSIVISDTITLTNCPGLGTDLHGALFEPPPNLVAAIQSTNNKDDAAAVDGQTDVVPKIISQQSHFSKIAALPKLAKTSSNLQRDVAAAAVAVVVLENFSGKSLAPANSAPKFAAASSERSVVLCFTSAGDLLVDEVQKKDSVYTDVDDAEIDSTADADDNNDDREQENMSTAVFVRRDGVVVLASNPAQPASMAEILFAFRNKNNTSGNNDVEFVSRHHQQRRSQNLTSLALLEILGGGTPSSASVAGLGKFCVLSQQSVNANNQGLADEGEDVKFLFRTRAADYSVVKTGTAAGDISRMIKTSGAADNEDTPQLFSVCTINSAKLAADKWGVVCWPHVSARLEQRDISALPQYTGADNLLGPGRDEARKSTRLFFSEVFKAAAAGTRRRRRTTLTDDLPSFRAMVVDFLESVNSRVYEDVARRAFLTQLVVKFLSAHATVAITEELFASDPELALLINFALIQIVNLCSPAELKDVLKPLCAPGSSVDDFVLANLKTQNNQPNSPLLRTPLNVILNLVSLAAVERSEEELLEAANRNFFRPVHFSDEDRGGVCTLDLYARPGQHIEFKIEGAASSPNEYLPRVRIGHAAVFCANGKTWPARIVEMNVAQRNSVYSLASPFGGIVQICSAQKFTGTFQFANVQRQVPYDVIEPLYKLRNEAFLKSLGIQSATQKQQPKKQHPINQHAATTSSSFFRDSATIWLDLRGAQVAPAFANPNPVVFKIQSAVLLFTLERNGVQTKSVDDRWGTKRVELPSVYVPYREMAVVASAAGSKELPAETITKFLAWVETCATTVKNLLGVLHVRPIVMVFEKSDSSVLEWQNDTALVPTSEHALVNDTERGEIVFPLCPSLHYKSIAKYGNLNIVQALVTHCFVVSGTIFGRAAGDRWPFGLSERAAILCTCLAVFEELGIDELRLNEKISEAKHLRRERSFAWSRVQAPDVARLPAATRNLAGTSLDQKIAPLPKDYLEELAFLGELFCG